MKRHEHPLGRTEIGLAALLVALVMVGCEGVEPVPPGHGGGEEDAGPGLDGAPVCVRPSEGCPCAPGTEPEECYPDPVIGPGGEMLCQSGARYCRDAAWTSCIAFGDPTALGGGGGAPLITGPTVCNPCDPRCFAYEDRPTTGADITPGNSTGVTLDPSGGVTLPTSGTYMGSGDMDGDGVPDDFDVYPSDPTRNGYTELGGIFHMLPTGATAGPDPISINTRITTADVYVLMDATGSMAGEIANLQSALTSGDFSAPPTFATAAVAGNEVVASAYNLGTDPVAGIYPRTGNTTGMADNYNAGGGYASCAGSGGAPDAIYRFTLTRNTVVTATTVGTGTTWDTLLSLRAAAFPAGTYLACNDDASSTVQSTITATLGPGTYYVMLEGYNGASGTYRVDFRFADPNCTAGVVGAVDCIIPGVAFGVGYFREYPISPHGVATNPSYRHVLDITTDRAAISTAVSSLVTEGNVDWPEALSQALYATTTGRGLGTDWPARPGAGFGACAAGRWGWPCFRMGTIPIVIAFTDAPTHEGPVARLDYPFDDRRTGNTSTAAGGESQASAYAIGDITSWINTPTRRSFTGTTAFSNNDYNTAVLGCNAGTRDRVFSFTLTATRRVQIDTLGSNFDTVLSLFNGSGIAAANRVECNDDLNYRGDTPGPVMASGGGVSQIVTTLNAGTYYLVIDGWNTSVGNYSINFEGRSPTTVADSAAPAYWYNTRASLLSTGTRFIGIRSCGPAAAGDEGAFCAETLTDLQAIGVATGSVDSGGAPYVYTIANDGSNLSTTLVNAVYNLANQTRFNITARATDNPATTFDERNFVQSITITNCPAARCSGPSTASTCGACMPATDVGFNVVFRNTGVAPGGVPSTMVPQVFDFTIEAVADGTSVLNSVPVRIVVPPIVPLYPASGSYWRDYDSTTRCLAPNERPDWGTLDWSASTPSGTSIVFEVRAADTLAALPGATPAILNYPGSTPPVDLGAVMVSAGYPSGLRYARVTAVLRSNAGRTAAPTMTWMRVNYACVPSE